MELVEFLRRARLSEQACLDDPDSYRRSVALFALLGHMVVIACGLAVLALLWVAAMGQAWGMGVAVRAAFGVVALLLGLSCAKALLIRLPMPQGEEVSELEAPQLFEALKRIRKRAGGPAIDRVLITTAFGVGIVPIAKWGLFGRPLHVLIIGLPLMMSVDKPQFFTLLAHEYGHFRKGQGTFSAFVYRCRLRWGPMQASIRASSRLASVGVSQFFDWYLPRFFAKSFAMRREDELGADAVAAGLISPKLAADALIEVCVKGDWLEQRFWPGHWRQAIGSSMPIGPFMALSTALVQTVDADFARSSIKSHWARTSGVADPHPPLKERVQAMVTERMGSDHAREWSAQSALRLFNKPKRLLEKFDAQWRRDHASAWTESHEKYALARKRCDALAAMKARANAHELVELGCLTVRLEPELAVRTIFEQALRSSPDHPRALVALSRLSQELTPHERFVHLSKLYDVSAAHRWWAADQIVDLLDANVDLAASMTSHTKTWRMKLKGAWATEERAIEELSDGQLSDNVGSHGLNEFELSELCFGLQCFAQVVQVWIAGKPLRDLTWRRAYVVVVALKDLGEDSVPDFLNHLGSKLDLPGPARIAAFDPLQPLKAPFVQIYNLREPVTN